MLLIMGTVVYIGLCIHSTSSRGPCLRASTEVPSSSLDSNHRPTNRQFSALGGPVAPATTESAKTPQYLNSNCSELEFAMAQETELAGPEDYLPVAGQQSNSPIMVI